MTVLIVAAAQFEIEPFTRALNLEGRSCESFICGIGALEAAKNSVPLEQAALDKEVIFLGSCGIFQSFEPLEIVECQTVHWLPYDLRVGKGYKIAGTMAPIHLRTAQEKKSAARLVDVVCSSTISLDPFLPEGFDSIKTVENIELYSVSAAILATCRSFRAFLAVTNAVGPNAHREWQANFAAAAQECANFIGKHLSGC
jgi:purine-nucleoside phosphorylase